MVAQLDDVDAAGHGGLEQAAVDRGGAEVQAHASSEAPADLGGEVWGCPRCGGVRERGIVSPMLNLTKHPIPRLLAAAFVTLAVAAPAQAATVAVDGATLIYTAAPGEQNTPLFNENRTG